MKRLPIPARMPTESGPKAKVTMYVEVEVLDWFRSLGRGWQSQAADVLRWYRDEMEARWEADRKAGLIPKD